VTPFYRSPGGQATFHGRVSKSRADKGFENYLNLLGHYRMRLFLDGEQHKEEWVTADPYAGTIEICIGAQTVTLSGHVEIRLERGKPSP
jgi:hypothetical protein